MPEQTRVVHVHDRILGAVYIGRKNTRAGLPASPFANPWRVAPDAFTREAAIAQYRAYLMNSPKLLARLPELRGKLLACWCRCDGEARTMDNACHGDVILEILAQYSDEELRAMGGSE